jgi:long-subunit acyl-CoA synthetase (AMP-forming)
MTTQTRPFDDSGVARGADGILRYQNRLPSLVESLRHSVDQFPDQEAVVELGGARLTYRQLWDRSARVAIRYGNGVDWCLAFFGIQLLGAIAVPVNTRFSEGEVEYVIHDSSSRYVFLPHQPLPDGPPFVVDDLTEDELSAIFYSQRRDDTSGTTGLTSHQNFLANVENC